MKLLTIINPHTRKPLRMAAENESACIQRGGQIRPPLFVANDACDGAGISDRGRALKMLDDDEKCYAEVETKGGRQRMVCVTEAGLFHLILMSRSPKARPFRRWLCHEVLPMIHHFGYYDPALIGATPEAAQKAMWRRCRQLRSARLAHDDAELAASGFVTVAQFRELHNIAARDGFIFARAVQFQASLASIKPRRFYRSSGMRNAWPKELLFLSLINFQPKLPLGDI